MHLPDRIHSENSLTMSRAKMLHGNGVATTEWGEGKSLEQVATAMVGVVPLSIVLQHPVAKPGDETIHG